LRRRRRVALRWDPRGPPPPRGGPPRFGAPAAPVVGAPGREPANPPPAPPGRDVGPPVRGAPVDGRALIGRGPPGPAGRPGPLAMGRRAPGGGGIGRPVELSGRPGGGGIGRPVELSGGRDDGAPPSPPSPDEERWVGRMVVGPSGDTVRVGTGLGAATRLRTTLGPSDTGSTGADGGGGASDGTVATGAGANGDSTGGGTALVTRVARAGGAAPTGASATTVVVDPLDALALVAFETLAASSGTTTRRRPSASARRRMRSAWASSMEAEGLDAPIPSFWASASNSLLVSPSSLESSCTRIFFWAKTFPCFSCPPYSEHSYLFFHNYRGIKPLPLPRPRNSAASASLAAECSALATCPARRSAKHAASRHHHTPRPVPRPRYQRPSILCPARVISRSSRVVRQTTHVRRGLMPCPPRSLRRSLRRGDLRRRPPPHQLSLLSRRQRQ
jgi:hypothetical protein